tara:strand:+ start:878 stop:1714 length:837 start_codon:yes stop_codon:yes gene_type:complete
MNNYIIIFFVVVLQSCDWISKDEGEDENVLARVGNSALYKKDILYSPSLGDSAEVYSSQVSLWIKKQLVLNSAFQNDEIMSEIQNKVDKYKESLMLFEFEKYLFSSSDKIEISSQEIGNYYEDNIEDFILPFNLVKALYVKVPIDAPSINTFRNNLRKYPNSDTTEIISYCFQFAEKSFLEDSTWIKFDDIMMNIPFPADIDRIRFLKSRSYYETRDDEHIHFLRILDKKFVGDFSPITFEEEIINTILLNNRKQELFDKLRDSIYNNSIRGVDYEIY